MNPDELEKQVLLKQSGELSREETGTLNRYLDEHPEAAKTATAYDRILDAYAGSRPELPAFPDLQRERILQEARRFLPVPESQTHIRSPRMTLAWAAAAALLLTGFWLFRPQTTAPRLETALLSEEKALQIASTPVIDARLETLSLELALTADKILEGDTDSLWQPLEQDIDTLANELLALTGEQI